MVSRRQTLSSTEKEGDFVCSDIQNEKINKISLNFKDPFGGNWVAAVAKTAKNMKKSNQRIFKHLDTIRNFNTTSICTMAEYKTILQHYINVLNNSY